MPTAWSMYITSLRKKILVLTLLRLFDELYIVRCISPVGMETSESSWRRRRPTWTTARGRTRRSTSSGSTVRSLVQPVQGSGSHTGSSVSTYRNTESSVVDPDQELFALTSKSRFGYGSEIKWNYKSSYRHSIKQYISRRISRIVCDFIEVSKKTLFWIFFTKRQPKI